jgi:hypothetical protein
MAGYSHLNEISQLAVSAGEGDCWPNVSGEVRKYSRLLLRDWETGST